MEEFTKKLLEDHRNPIVKLENHGPKLFLKSEADQAEDLTLKYLNNMETSLGHIRVDRRCARAQAEWTQEKYMAKVIKVIKGLVHTYGFQDKTGIYLYSEEMLYLVESNRLEMLQYGKPMTIQECYDIVINDPNCGLDKYRAYKKLVLLGYRLVRQSEILRKGSNKTVNEISEPELKKCKLDSDAGNCTQVIEIKSTSKNVDTYNDDINILFNKIRQNVPSEFEAVSDKDLIYDYGIFTPSNKSRTDCDYLLIICHGNIFEAIKHIGSKPVIYAVCEENIFLYDMSYVRLPIL